MRILTTLIFLSLSAIMATAQTRTVEGVVMDSVSGEKLIGASILCGKQGTLTDEKGLFKFEINRDEQYLFVSYIGYKSKQVAIGNEKLTVLLLEQSRFLNPVVVSATRQNQKEELTTVSVANIQPYLIQNRITTSVENTIQQIPGVTSTDGQVNIRSGSGWSYGTGSRVSVLVDDMPMMAAGTGQALWAFFPIENVRQIEVIKGSSSVLYGSSALNGVINIRTDWPGNKELVSAAIFSGVYDNPENPNWRWQGKRVLSKSGGHVRYGKGGERYQYVFSVNGLNDEGYRMGEPDKRIRLSGKSRFFSQDKRLTVGLNSNFLLGKSGGFLLWENYDLAYTSLDSSFGLTSSTRFNIDPYAEFKGKEFDYLLQFRLYDVVSNIEQISGDPDQSNATRSVYSEYRMKWKRFQEKGLVVNLGLVSMYGESRATIFQGHKVQQNQAAFFQSDYQNKRWNISAGARYEHYRLENYSEGKPVFKFGLNYRAAKATFLRASFGQGYRFPVVSETFIRTNAGPVSIYPNEQLKAESGYTAELGIRQGIEFKNGIKLMADLAAYRMYFENMMEFTFGQWGDLSQPLGGLGFKSINIGPSLIQGFEFSLTGGGEWGANKLMVLAGYTYADPVNLDPNFSFVDGQGNASTYKQYSTDTSGTLLKYRNRHLIKTDIQYERTRFGLGASYRYASQYEAIDAPFVLLSDLSFPGVERAMEDANNGNHVIDLRAFYRINTDWKITLAINNLLNEVVLSRPCDIGPPRHFSLQISYRY